MKRKGMLCLPTVLAAGMLLGGCGQRAPEAETPEKEGLKIVCTVFPEYDWTRELVGDFLEDTELTLLMKNGSDMHSYQPSFRDVVKIEEADLLIHVGGESDFWVEDILENREDSCQKVLNLMELLEDSMKEEETVEGMEGGHAHVHEHEEPEYDEHVWLSLKNAKKACGAIGEALMELDPEHADIYRSNMEEYQEELEQLDQEYQRAVDASKLKTLLFGDRFPFRYLTEDYGLSYYAAFPGCSAETEAGFGTITFLAEKADELSVPVILTVDGSDQKIARTIAGNTRSRRQRVLTLDSMQSVTEKRIEEGETYLSVMKENLPVLCEALAVEGR